MFGYKNGISSIQYKVMLRMGGQIIDVFPAMPYMTDMTPSTKKASSILS